MKSKMKHFSKSSLSMLLALIMLVSTVAVGIVTSNAAFKDLASSGDLGSDTMSEWWIVGYQEGNFNNWSASFKDYSISSNTGTITVTSSSSNKIYFKLVSTASNDDRYLSKPSNGTISLAKGTTYELQGSTNGDNPFKNWTDLRNAYTQLDYTPSGDQDYIDFTITTSNNKKYLTITERNITPDFYVVGRFKNDSVQDDWSSDTTNYHFTETSTGIYKYETQQNLTELSSEIQCNNYKAVQYFYIWDKNTNTYYNTANNRNAMQNVYTSAHSVSLSSCTFDSGSNWLYFGSDNSSYGVSKDSDLVFWVDTTGTTPKFYYTTADTATYTVTSSAGTGGSVNPPSAIAGDASTAEFKATASSGYEFTSWTLSSGVTVADGYTTSSNPIKVNATAAGTVKANFGKSTWPPVDITGFKGISDRIIYVDSDNSNNITNNNKLDSQYIKANDNQTSIWVDFTSLLKLSDKNHFYFGLSNRDSYTGFYSSSSSKVVVNSENAPGVAGGSLTNKDSKYYFAQIWGDNNNPLSDLTHLGCMITKGANNTMTYTVYTGSTYDPFYVGGRFVTDSAYTGSYRGDWETQSKAIQFDEGSGSEWTLETGKTIAELSTALLNSTQTSTNPQYFIIHDGVDNYAVSAKDGSGWNFEEYNSSNKALTLNPISGALDTNHEMVFIDPDSTSDGKVVLHINATDYDPGNSASELKIWYTLKNETPAVANHMTFTVSPEATTVNKNATLTATIADIHSGVDSTDKVQVIFEKYNGSTWDEVDTVTGTDITVPETGKMRAQTTVTNATPGAYTYRARVKTTDSYSGTSLREISKSASGTWNAQTVYYTDDITSSVASPTWSAVPTTGDKTATINTTLTEGNSYTIALSDEAAYNPNFEDFTIDTELTKYCDIKIASKTVTIDNEDRVVRTYVITPRTNCSNPVITIDAANEKIYAVATFDKYGDSGKTLSNSTETVKYYFAKEASVDSNNGTNLDGNKGLHIGYYNNSVVSKGAQAWAVPVKADGTTSTGDYTASSSTYTGTSDYQIYIDESQLFEYQTGNKKSSSSTKTLYNVYVLEMPIWATSAWLVGSNGQNQLTKNNKENNILSLNPNRIYVFWHTGTDNKQWSGVPLDTSFWVSEQSGAHKRGDDGYKNNQVPTKNFKTNLINYETGNQYTGTINPQLSTEYTNRSISRRLYWGMFAEAWEKNWDVSAYSSFYYPLNLAQRNDDHSYYASMWNTVNPELSKDTSNNPLGGGMLRAYDSDELMPFFDYDYLKTTDGKKVGTAYTDKDFPFYASQFDGVTTYSYDSAVDLNRHYKVSTGKYEVESGVTKLGNNIGYQPFHNESVTDNIAGFANEYDINFYMTTTGKLQGTNENHDISFNFSGDDDVWVFVDGVLVLDLGGAHKISAGSINFSDMKVYYKTAATDFTTSMGCEEDFATSSDNVYTMDLKALFEAHGVNFKNTDATTKHTLQMFYTERGRLESNMSLSFNLPQASGLNIRNTVLANNVNAGLKDVALQASDPDYFTYRVGNMAADDAAINTLIANNPGTIYANALLPSSTNGWSASNVTPVFPYKFNVSRFFEGDTMILGSTADKRDVTNGDVLSNLTNSWQYLKNTVFDLSDYYTPDNIADGAKLSGITNSDNGYFHMLGGQMANFTDKIRPNSYVQVVQTQELGKADPNTENNNIIKYSPVSDNNTGNYYITSYDIYDEAAAKNVVDERMYTVRYGNNDADNYYADDESAVTNGFYFTNYADDSSNPNPAMTVNFYNDIAVGDLTIEKELTKTSTVSDNFYFKVEFENIFGDDSYSWDEYDVEYTVHNVSDGTQVGTKQSYGTVGIVIKPGQYAKISGIPVETRYRVTEVSRAGYTLSDIDKTAKKLDGNAINTTYVPSGFYEFTNQSDATASTSGGVTQEGWSNGNMTALDKTYVNTNIDPDYTYYCNMIPVVPETLVSGDDYVSTSAFVFTNKKESYTIQFKYYDRYRINGTTAGINSTPTVYSVSLESLPTNGTGTLGDYITYVGGIEANGVQSIDFSKLIGYYAKEFAENKLNVNNVMCEYEMWTSQESAVSAMNNRDYFKGNGTTGKFTAEEAKYHATYLGKPNSSGEKWVTFTDTNRSEVTELSTPSDYLNVRNITVWCYNTPKQYKVNVYGADSFDDLIEKPVGSNTVYVADHTKSVPQSTGNMFYYNQRFGTEVAGADDLNAAGFISNYGIPGVYSGNLCPQNYASASISSGNDTYNFAYWAYDQAGTQLASTDIKYKYRVSTDTDLYAVYVKGNVGADVGISVSANDNDTYLDSNGTSYTRLNVMANVYNAADYDPLVEKISFVNITLSTQIRQHPETYTPAKINELFNANKSQLLSIIQFNETNRNFSFSGRDNGKESYTDGTINLTLTTRGFIYTVTSNGNTAAAGEPEIQLTNKNRGQLTVSYKTSTLIQPAKPTCLVYCGAVKYNGQWKISDNCLIYRNGDVTDNTKTSWN